MKQKNYVVTFRASCMNTLNLSLSLTFPKIFTTVQIIHLQVENGWEWTQIEFPIVSASCE